LQMSTDVVIATCVKGQPRNVQDRPARHTGPVEECAQWPCLSHSKELPLPKTDGKELSRGFNHYGHGGYLQGCRAQGRAKGTLSGLQKSVKSLFYNAFETISPPQRPLYATVQETPRGHRGVRAIRYIYLRVSGFRGKRFWMSRPKPIANLAGTHRLSAIAK
jgi:hypothetical protein